MIRSCKISVAVVEGLDKRLEFEHGCARSKDMQELEGGKAGQASTLNTSESKGSIQQSTVGRGIPSSQGSLIERPVIIIPTEQRGVFPDIPWQQVVTKC